MQAIIKHKASLTFLYSKYLSVGLRRKQIALACYVYVLRLTLSFSDYVVVRDIVLAVCPQKQWYFSHNVALIHATLRCPSCYQTECFLEDAWSAASQLKLDGIVSLHSLPFPHFLIGRNPWRRKVLPVVFTPDLKPFTNYFSRHPQANNSPCYCLTSENTINRRAKVASYWRIIAIQ